MAVSRPHLGDLGRRVRLDPEQPASWHNPQTEQIERGSRRVYNGRPSLRRKLVSLHFVQANCNWCGSILFLLGENRRGFMILGLEGFR